MAAETAEEATATVNRLAGAASGSAAGVGGGGRGAAAGGIGDTGKEDEEATAAEDEGAAVAVAAVEMDEEEVVVVAAAGPAKWKLWKVSRRTRRKRLTSMQGTPLQGRRRRTVCMCVRCLHPGHWSKASVLRLRHVIRKGRKGCAVWQTARGAPSRRGREHRGRAR